MGKIVQYRKLSDKKFTIIINLYSTVLIISWCYLGIHLLSGGNKNIQKTLIDYLQEKKDVRFFTSLAGLMSKCSVLNLEMFERQIKAEGLGMGAELVNVLNICF